jgi:branched-chain amino acid transport system permease protein
MPKRIVKGSPAHRVYQVVGWIVLGLVVLYVVYGLQDYMATKFSLAVSFGLAILGLNLVTGYSGQVSLGHSAFFGIGAYTTAVLMADSSWSWYLTLPAAAVIGGVVGFLVGLPALRIKGLYLALVTLAIAVVFPTMVKWVDDKGWISTGGANGKAVASVDNWVAPGWLPGTVSSNDWRFLVICAVAGVLFLGASNLTRSRVGRGLVALRDNEVGAAVSGVFPAGFKTSAFAISSVYAAVAGSCYTLAVGTVSPDTFGLVLSIQFIAGLVVGGVATISGSMLGGGVIEFLPYYTADWFTGPRANILLGLVLIVVIFIAPGGVMWFVRKMRAKLVVFVPQLPQISPARPSEVQSAPTAPEAAASVPDTQGGQA